MRITRDQLLYDISHMTDSKSERELNDVQKFSKKELLAIHSFISLNNALIGQLRQRTRQLERLCRADR